MAVKEIAEWSTTDASNNFVPTEGGWPELMARSDVNDVARRNMGAIRRWYEDPEWLDLTVGASISRTSATELSVLSGNFTAYFTDGRRVQITESSGGPTYATVDGDSVLDGGNTTVMLKDFTGGTEIPTDLVQANLQIISIFNTSAFLGEVFVTVPTLTGLGLQAAIDTLEAAAGGIIVLEADATYVIETTVVIGDGANPGNIRIMGRGATLQAGSVTPLDDEILDIRDTTPGAIEARVVLEDIHFDGDASNQTGTTGVGLLNIGEDTSLVTIRNCRFDDSYGPGITIKTSSRRIWIEGCWFINNGEDGILMEDSDSDMDEVFINRCSFDNPAARTGVAIGAGIVSAGKVTISDCHFRNLDHTSDIQIGINCDTKKSASPSDESARQNTIVGNRFEGTGLNAIGIWLRGRENVISGCSFKMTGLGSLAITVDDEAGGQTETNFHTISGCVIYDAFRGIRCFGSAEDVVVTGCNINDSPNPLTDQGKRNTFTGNHLTNCTDAVRVDATAEDSVYTGNTIDTVSAEGIEIIAGAARTQLYWNHIRNVTGTEIIDGGTDTVLGIAELLHNKIMFLAAGDPTELDLADLNVEYVFPETALLMDDFADGTRSWIIQHFYCAFAITSGANDFILRLRMGDQRITLPTADALIAQDNIAAVDYTAPADYEANFGNANDAWFPAMLPDNGDELYLTGERTSGGPSQSVLILLDDETVAGESCYWLIKPRLEKL